MFSTSKIMKHGSLALLLIAGLGGTAYANTMVVRAGGPSAKQYPAGKALAANAKITLKAGDTLTVLDSKGTRVLKGPGVFSAEAGSGAATNTSFASIVSTQKSRTRTGAVRGTGVRASPTSIWMVDMDKSSTICLPDTKSVQLWRPDMQQAVNVTLLDESSGVTSTASFAMGSNTVLWPTNALPIREGANYTISQPGKTTPTKIRFSLGVSTNDPVNTYAALDQRGCTVQRDLLVEAMTPAPDVKPAAAMK